MYIKRINNSYLRIYIRRYICNGRGSNIINVHLQTGIELCMNSFYLRFGEQVKKYRLKREITNQKIEIKIYKIYLYINHCLTIIIYNNVVRVQSETYTEIKC